MLGRQSMMIGRWEFTRLATLLRTIGAAETLTLVYAAQDPERR